MDIDITITHDTTTDDFRDLINLYPTGRYLRPDDRENGCNWFRVVVGGYPMELKLTWFADVHDANMMDDWFENDKAVGIAEVQEIIAQLSKEGEE